MTNDELTHEIANAQLEIKQLRQQIERLERMSVGNSLPDTMILDPSFIKRAFAVYGHMIVAGLIVAAPIYCLIFFIALAGL